MTISDAATKWAFSCVTNAAGKPPAGGLVLQQVTHDGHNFAKDIRVIGFWLETELVDPTSTPERIVSTTKKFYVLDDTTFTVSGITTLTPTPTTNPVSGATFNYLKDSDAALDFGSYFKDGVNSVACGVSAKYDAPALVGSLPNCEYAGLSIEEIFLFSRYSNSPKHEPSGGLSAARFHPMIRYAFSKNAGFDDKKQFTRLRSIRFDYRLQLYLDRHYDIPTNATLPRLGNQAALFADSDSAVGTSAVALGSGIWNLRNPFGAASTTSGAFDAVEKPLILEITAPGLGKGFSKFKSTPSGGGSPVDVRGWDNVHWWGARGGNATISAPGAFHCAHLHWRWGAAASLAGAKVNPMTPNTITSDPHFNPSTYPAGLVNPAVKGMWGPLVDPGIWIQTLRLAVVNNEAVLDPTKGATPAALSKDNWASLFDPGLGRAPADINKGGNGEDIVLWFSSEVHRDLTDSSAPAGSPYLNPSVPSLSSGSYSSGAGGTVFIHGIFFAHDAEKGGFGVGSTDPVYKPTDEAKIRSGKNWVRTAG
jgi:hypothetical protein